MPGRTRWGAHPCVAVVGRPNVGKSTLFNRLAHRRRAIVEDRPGVTVDRHYAVIDWDGRPVTLIDTGGFDTADTDDLRIRMREQAELAAGEADAVLFVVDGRDGLVPEERTMAGLLRRLHKPVFLVVNKLDHHSHDDNMWEFAELGFEGPFGVSAEHGRGIGDVIDAVTAVLPAGGDAPDEPAEGAIAVVGRPNTGKSTLVNRLLGEARQVVSPTAGTTRDAVDTPMRYHGRTWLLVDTAGIRRKRAQDTRLERISMFMALKALDRADVAVVMLDAVEGFTHQDARILGFAVEKGKAVVLVVNKWDAVEKDNDTAGAFVKALRDEAGFASWAPVLLASALTGQRVARLMEIVEKVTAAHRRRIGTAELNRWLEAVVARHHPPVIGTKPLKMYFMSQVAVSPPCFVVVTNSEERVHFSYERYLENRLRESFDFEGTPIRFFFRRKKARGRGKDDPTIERTRRDAEAEGVAFVEYEDVDVSPRPVPAAEIEWVDDPEFHE